MTSQIALGVWSKLAAGKGVRTAMRIAAKGVFLLAMAFMIVTYAVSVSQSAQPAPEPLPDYIYS